MEYGREGPIRFGILGCAEIARKVARAILTVQGASLRAIGSRSLDKAKAFAAANGVPGETQLYGSYDQVLDDDQVDVVYIPLPHKPPRGMGRQIRQKEETRFAGKASALTVGDLDEIIEACDGQGVQLMDGTMGMHHPRTAQMEDHLRNPDVFGGTREVHVIFSYAYSSSQEFGESNIRMRADLDALGAQGDMGWYCCRAILWANRYQMPRTVTAMPAPQFTDAGVVVSCGATFTWEDGRLATYRCSFTAHTTMSLLVQGAKGTLHVEDFVIPIEEARASYSLVSEATFKDLLVGWENKPQLHSVSVAVPQEAEMIKEMSKLVKNVRDEGGKADSFWPDITRKTQVLVNAVMDSIHANFSTINIA